jgi:hypothetical protein
MQRVHVAVGRRPVQAGPDQQLPERAVAGHAGVLHAAGIADDLLAVGVGEAATPPLVAGKMPLFGCLRTTAAREDPDGLVARVSLRLARENAHARARNPRPQRGIDGLQRLAVRSV